MSFKEALESDPTIETEVLAKYPIFNETYRAWLNQQIKDHYWNHEIGMESVSMFKLALKRKMNQIMPYYNKQYKADLLADGVDPLQTLRMVNESESVGNSTTAGDSTSDSTSDSAARNIASDFPQHLLSADGDYASNGADSVSKASSASKAAETTSQEQESRGKTQVTGSNGQTSVLIMQHRQTLINVDVMLLSELDDLFMQIWSNGDSFTNNRQGMGSVGYGYGYFGIFGY